jgi:hypothetical protein
MNRFTYILLAGPFIILAKFFEFIVWGLFCSDIKPPMKSSRPPTYQEQAIYIQQLLKELREEKRRGNDLHDYYRRREKTQHDESERQKRREDEDRRKSDRSKN